MSNQVYNIINKDQIIEVYKNETLIYQISIKEKLISLPLLYKAMQVDINDEYSFAKGLSKIEIPQNDSERIFNNVHDFINHLLYSLNQKLLDLRKNQTIDKCM